MYGCMTRDAGSLRGLQRIGIEEGDRHLSCGARREIERSASGGGLHNRTEAGHMGQARE